MSRLLLVLLCLLLLPQQALALEALVRIPRSLTCRGDDDWNRLM